MSEDGTGKLCALLYGEAKACDYLGGSDARMLHDAAKQIGTLRDLMIDAWLQWGIVAKVRGERRRFGGALSTLEDIEDYLREQGLIDELGFLTAKAGRGEVK